VRFLSLRECSFDLARSRFGVVLPGFEEALPDGVFVRGVPGGTLEQVVHYLDVLHALRALDVPVCNDGRAVERSVDKGMTSFLLAGSAIPTPPTWVCADLESAAATLRRETAAGHDLVCKPLFGAMGKGLVRLGAGDALPEPATVNGIYYLQRFVESGAGRWHDWRVFVLDGRVLGAMRRSADHWITNVARGGACTFQEPDAELERLAVAATRALEMDYAGVDLIRDREGRTFVVEVNGIPAWRGLQSVCGVNIAEALVAHLLQRVLTRRAPEVVS